MLRGLEDGYQHFGQKYCPHFQEYGYLQWSGKVAVVTVSSACRDVDGGPEQTNGECKS